MAQLLFNNPTKLTSKVASIGNLCCEACADDRGNHGTVHRSALIRDGDERPTYKLLRPSNADRPILNFKAIWRLYMMTAGIIVKAISVNVFVAPWK